MMKHKALGIIATFALMASIFHPHAIAGQVSVQDSLPIQAKGMYIWKLWSADGGNLNSVISKLKGVGVTWVVIKMGDGDSYYNSPNHSLYNWAIPAYGSMDSVVSIFHQNGIKIFAFQYVYGIPHRWNTSGPTESGVANLILDVKNIDGLIIDAEIEYDTLANRVAAAAAYLDTIRAYHPGSFLGLTAWARINGHSTFPWTTFLNGVEVNMPQTYWAARPTTPQNELYLMSSQFTSATQTWVSQGDSAAAKPIMPLGQGEYFGYSNDVEPGDITSFCDLSQKTYNYAGVSLWEYAQIDSPYVWSEYTSAWAPTSVREGASGPGSYNLYQNYPNPFNPTTAINYKLSALSRVTLKVYDVLGREVTTLVDQDQNPGPHTVVFNASGLASGVYFYTLKAGTYKTTKKMMLLK